MQPYLPVIPHSAYHPSHLQVAAAQEVEGSLAAQLEQAQQEVQSMTAQHAETTAKLQQELSQAQARAEELARQQETASSGWTQSKDTLAQLQQELDAAQAALAEGGGDLLQARPALCALQHTCGGLLGATGKVWLAELHQQLSTAQADWQRAAQSYCSWMICRSAAIPVMAF